MTLPAGSTVSARRPRQELALVVAAWAFWRWVDGEAPEDPPASLVRPDEIATAESLEAWELMLAAGLLVDSLALHMAARGRRNVRRIRAFADSMYGHAERSYARLYAGDARPRRSLARPRGRVRRGARRCRSPGRRSDDPDLDDEDDVRPAGSR